MCPRPGLPPALLTAAPGASRLIPTSGPLHSWSPAKSTRLPQPPACYAGLVPLLLACGNTHNSLICSFSAPHLQFHWDRPRARPGPGRQQALNAWGGRGGPHFTGGGPGAQRDGLRSDRVVPGRGWGWWGPRTAGGAHRSGPKAAMCRREWGGKEGRQQLAAGPGPALSSVGRGLVRGGLCLSVSVTLFLCLCLWVSLSLSLSLSCLYLSACLYLSISVNLPFPTLVPSPPAIRAEAWALHLHLPL